MTTAQRARELAADITAPLCGIPCTARDKEVAAILESHARMLEAALPESVQEIKRAYERRLSAHRTNRTPVPDVEFEVSTLLGVVQALTVELKDATNDGIADYTKFVARRAETYAIAEKACKERDAARAEVERLKAEREQINNLQAQLGWTGKHGQYFANMEAAKTEAAKYKDLFDGSRADMVEYQRRLAVILRPDPVLYEWEEKDGNLVPRE